MVATTNGNGHAEAEPTLQVMQARTLQANRLRALAAVASDLIMRGQVASLAGLTFGGKRDLYDALGYARTLRLVDFRERFKRGGLARRLVTALPTACWRGSAELQEDANPETHTAFETAWNALQERLHVWSVFQRTDILAGLGNYACILIGAVGELATELPKMKDESGVLYLTPYSEEELRVESYVEKTSDPRFGLPVRYQLSTSVGKTKVQSFVHHSRVLHVADGLLDDRVNGDPRLAVVWNYLDDLDKVVGGGSEAFWLRAHQGFHADIDPEMKLKPDEIAALQNQVEEFAHQMRRTVGTKGVKFEALGSDVANFANQVDAIVTLLAGTIGIPKRILVGSEMGQLASSQDRENWNERVADRRHDFCEAMVIRPFVDRLIKVGGLPAPKQYEVRWPELIALSAGEKADIATKWADLNQKAGETVVTGSEIRDRVLDLDPLSPEQLAQQDQGGVPGE